MAGAGAEPEPKLWTKVEPEQKINNFGSATLVFSILRYRTGTLPISHERKIPVISKFSFSHNGEKTLRTSRVTVYSIL